MEKIPEVRKKVWTDSSFSYFLTVLVSFVGMRANKAMEKCHLPKINFGLLEPESKSVIWQILQTWFYTERRKREKCHNYYHGNSQAVISFHAALRLTEAGGHTREIAGVLLMQAVICNYELHFPPLACPPV